MCPVQLNTSGYPYLDLDADACARAGDLLPGAWQTAGRRRTYTLALHQLAAAIRSVTAFYGGQQGWEASTVQVGGRR